MSLVVVVLIDSCFVHTCCLDYCVSAYFVVVNSVCREFSVIGSLVVEEVSVIGCIHFFECLL